MAFTTGKILKLSYSLPNVLKKMGLGNPKVFENNKSLLLATSVSNLLGLALPLAILQVYDRIIPHSSLETMLGIFLILVASSALDFIITTVRYLLNSWSGSAYSVSAVYDVLSRVLKQPYLALEKDSPQRINERVDALSQIGDFLGSQSRLVMIDVPFFLVFLGFIAAVGGWLVVVPILVIGLFSLSAFYAGRSFYYQNEARLKQDIKITDFLSETISSMALVKALSFESFMQRRYERLSRSSAHISYDNILSNSHAQNFSVALSNAMIIGMATVGGLLAAHDMISMGRLACCTMLSGRMSQPLLRLVSLWHELQRVSSSLDDVGSLCELKKAAQFKKATESDLPIPVIEVRDLQFTAQNGSDAETFLNITIQPNSFTLIRSRDNRNTSYFLKMLRGSILPEQGEILYDFCPVLESTYYKQNLMALVSGSPVMFSGTIRDNLTFFEKGPSITDAFAATKLINLERDIHRLPAGYETLIGDGAQENLPQGFLQRIALARALALKPKLLFLDEPQALLDFEADQFLISALEKLKGTMTLVFVSSRPSYQKLADQFIELDFLLPQQPDALNTDVRADHG